MKQLAIMFAAICAVGFMASESQAQHYRGHGGHHSGFSISVGNGFSGVSYNNYGHGNRYGYSHSYGGGLHRPVYSAPVYRNYGGHYSSGYRGGYGGGYSGGYRGGYSGGYSRGCGGGGIIIGW